MKPPLDIVAGICQTTISCVHIKFVSQPVLELCEEIVRRKVEIAWICASRVDTVDLELLRTMKKAGCIQIGFGVESGSQKILNYYRKGLKKERIAPAFRMCQEVGIIARANIMIGAPHETTADVQETISLLRKIKPDLIAVSVTTPIPGTDLFTDANEKGILRKGVLGVYDRFYIDTMKRALSDSEIKKLIRKIVRAYLYEIAVLLLNPFELYKRRHLFYRILVHWGTLLKNPQALVKDIVYYLHYPWFAQIWTGFGN